MAAKKGQRGRSRMSPGRAARAERKEELARESARVADKPRPRKNLPAGALVSLGVALLVVGGASLFLWVKTDKPGPALERWASATRDGDCEASYGGLSSSARQAPLIGDEANWCRIIGSHEFIGRVEVGRADTKGSKACVHATVTSSNGPAENRVFVMAREGRSWKVDVGADPAETGIAGCENPPISSSAGGPT